MAALESEQFQGNLKTCVLDPPTSEREVSREDPNVVRHASLRIYGQRDRPHGDFATIDAGNDHAITRITDPADIDRGLCQSPDMSDSGSSLDKNLGNSTPPPERESPLPSPSPGPAGDLGRLSLENANSRSYSQRGRGLATATHNGSWKRAASSEFPPRDKPPSVPHAGNHQCGPHAAQGPGRLQRDQPGPIGGKSRQISSRQNSGVHHGQRQRPDSKASPGSPRHGMKARQPVGRDSGYETMPSRQNTVQELTPKALGKAKNTQPSQKSTGKEGKPYVTQPPISVPVLTDARYPDLIMQPESSPISQEQLAAEVKGIYGGLVMVEAKCINIDAAQAADPNTSLGKDQWQALIALHRTLLYEHHDFLMATQHPSATPALSGLAQKYSMPARMWRHGIHAFLEVLRHRRPESHEYMIAFIYLAYQMMALLFETVPAFLDTWIECLGDLARYRMAIEEDREIHSVWGGVAAHWYRMASNRHPAIGRLYHHLGILERASLRKMFLYTKSLTCVLPFPNARDSMTTLCGPIVQEQQVMQADKFSFEVCVVRLHAYFYAASDNNTALTSLASEVLFQMQSRPCPSSEKYVELLVSNIGLLFELGAPSNQLWQLYSQAINAAIQQSRPSAATPTPAITKREPENQDTLSALPSTASSELVYDFVYSSFNCVVRRGKDPSSLLDILPSLHVILVWFHGVFTLQSRLNEHNHTLRSLSARFAWTELAELLNILSQHEPISTTFKNYASQGLFPPAGSKDFAKVLAEDVLMHGLVWSQFLFPTGWLDDQTDDDKEIQMSEMNDARADRIQRLGLFLAFNTEYINFDETNEQFYAPKLAKEPQAVIIPSYLQREESTADQQRSDAWETDTTTKSLASTSPSAHSDSDDFVFVKSPRTRSHGTWAKVASKPVKKEREQNGVQIVDDAMKMELG